jgi:alkyl sulfatase BDS1-like metallo-beta-lactamase superfamily hydrolase
LLTCFYDFASFLLQVYGAIEGHVKSAADRYTGWFNGEAEDLVPNTKAELAANMVRDFGRERIIQRARKAYEEGNYRWALTLATYVWRAENQSRTDALYWRTQAMKRIADNTLAVHWRNYLYGTALVDNGLVNPLYVSATLINSKPLYLYLHTIDMCFELMTFHLNPEKAAGVDVTIDLALTDDPRLPAGQVSMSSPITVDR